MAALGVELERHGAAVEADLERLEVDLGLARLHQRLDVLLRQHDRQQADLRAVGEEDVGEARGDDRLEAVVLQRPRGVLAAGAAAEVRAGREDRVLGQAPAGLLRPVVEQELAEARALDPLQELLGDDLVGVDVGARERGDGTLDDLDRFHLVPLPDVDEMALDRGRGRHLRGDEVGAPAAALTALEVAVGGRGAALARLEDVRVHAQAHRAARGAPVEARGAEDLVEALALGLLGHLLGARDDHRATRSRRPCGP